MILIKPITKTTMLKLFMNAGPKNPWGGSWGSSGDNNSGNDKNKKPNNKTDSDTKAKSIDDRINEFLKKISDFLKNLSGDNKNQNPGDNSKTPKSILGLIILGIILFWLSLGFYKVDTDENAIVLYFGKFYAVSSPGLNYHIPYPFGNVIKKSVTIVNTEEFGFSSKSSGKDSKRNFDAESLMLTGDENIVDIEFQVQWQIADIKDYIFNIAVQNQTIRETSESTMREIIARTPIADALSDGKKRIEQEAKDLLQQTLDSYGAGIRVVLVQLRRVDPPAQVIDAFRDVQTAKADKEKEINEAQAYSNDIIPRARGMASQLVEQAEAYNKEVVTNAEGEAGRFISVYKQYIKSKRVTKKRIYLETMEKIYRDIDKVIIDKAVGKTGVVPYLPLNEIQQPKKQN